MPEHLWCYKEENMFLLCKKENNLFPHSLRKNQQYNGGLWILDECPSFSCVCFFRSATCLSPYCFFVVGPQIEGEESWLSLGEEEQRALPLTVPGSI